METTISAASLAKNLSSVLNRVKNRGERFVVERHGERVATIVPATPPATVTLGDFLALLRQLPPPDDDFARDVDALRSALRPQEMPEWPS
jgi:antitoxin (DNA-binding transcriptional repressor) of toxin-antitoxin stability system